VAGEGDGDRRGDCEESDGHGLLEENYDVSRVSVREQAEARKGFCAVKPSSSCNCGVEAMGVGRSRIGNPLAGKERVCCLLVLNLVSSTLSCIRQPRPRLSLASWVREREREREREVHRQSIDD
jgi:hypothetical protein